MSILHAVLPLAACLLAGCAASPTPSLRAATTHAPAVLDQQFASTSLDDSQLGAVRGGFVLGAGVELRFAFQEATYVNRNLVQNLVSPMITLTGGAGAVPILSANTGSAPMPPSTLDIRGQGTGTLVVGGSVPFNAATMGSGLASGGLSVTSGMANISMSGVGGLTNFITNTLNGQLVQQATRVDITISGLNGLQRPSAPLVMDMLRGAQILPR